jgi:hypothetical protein
MAVQAKHAEVILQKSFAQPVGQAIPREFLAMLAELDRSKR